MKFQPHIAREQIPAMAAWGTQQEVELFFSNGIDLKQTQWQDFALDIRQDIHIQETGVQFYVLEQTHEYQAWIICGGIVIDKGRFGFYALGLFYPVNRAPLNPPFSLLQSLNTLFQEKYVHADRIVITQEANAYFFKQAIEQQPHLFAGNAIISVTDGQQAVCFYANNVALTTLFTQYQETHFQLFRRLYWLPQSSASVDLKSALLHLNEISQKQLMYLKVLVYAEDDQTQQPLKGVTFEIFKNNHSILTTSLSQINTYVFTKAVQDDIRFLAAKKDYQTFDLAKADSSTKVVFKTDGSQMYLGIPLRKKPTSHPPVTANVENDSQIKQKVIAPKKNQIKKVGKSSLLSITKDKKNHKVRRTAITDQPKGGFQKYRIWLVSVAALVLAFITFRATNNSTSNSIDWRERTENLLQLSNRLLANNWQWDQETYQKFQQKLVQQKNELDKLHKEGKRVTNAIDLDSLNQVVQQQSITTLNNAIQEHLNSDRFDYKKSNKLLVEAKQMNLANDRLERYHNICIYILFADKIIQEGYKNGKISIPGQKEDYTINHIINNFQTLLYKAKPSKGFAFLKLKHRKVLTLYLDLLTAYRFKKFKSVDELANYVLVRYSPRSEARKKLQEIKIFLRKRGIE
ncbi:MAG TPA: hypothetical protein DCS93_07115 [Microscillaceae bacterium]|nr:hypothetical protein [Microscillaceae bacterium]